MTRSVGSPKLLPFNPPVDPIPEFRKPFTPTPGLFIVPLKTGTPLRGHRHPLLPPQQRRRLRRPSHLCPRRSLSSRVRQQRHVAQEHRPAREEIVALGSMGYQNATNAMVVTIGGLARSVAVWNKAITRLGEFVDGEDPTVTKNCQENQREMEKATKAIENLNKLHDEVPKCRTNPDQRIIGFVLHAEPIVVSDRPYGFTGDWTFIQLCNEVIDWDTFPGNKVYVGTFPISSRSFSFG